MNLGQSRCCNIRPSKTYTTQSGGSLITHSVTFLLARFEDPPHLQASLTVYSRIVMKGMNTTHTETRVKALYYQYQRQEGVGDVAGVQFFGHLQAHILKMQGFELFLLRKCML